MVVLTGTEVFNLCQKALERLEDHKKELYRRKIQLLRDRLNRRLVVRLHIEKPVDAAQVENRYTTLTEVRAALKEEGWYSGFDAEQVVHSWRTCARAYPHAFFQLDIEEVRLVESWTK